MILLLAAALAAAPTGRSAEARSGKGLQRWLKAVNSVGPEGAGNEKASRAWKRLAAQDASQLVDVLNGMKGSNELSENWLRSAAETIADRTLEGGGKLPVADLQKFIGETGQNPRARRLAFELIRRVEPKTAEKMIPGLANDPSVELRREAVQRLMNQGSKQIADGKKEVGGATLKKALDHARDIDQIKSISKSLRELGHEIDLPRHFGFLMHWNVIGPFDNTDRGGFDTVFPPEKAIDLTAEYDGKKGRVNWSELVSSDEFGMVDINQAYPGNIKEVTAYAYTEFKSKTARPIELRLGCKNAWKVWLNGKLLFGRDEYHRGMRIDQYRLKGELKQGTNTILIKACQNEQKESWTKEWQFQLRVCDATGTAELAEDRPPTPKSAPKGKKTASVN